MRVCTVCYLASGGTETVTASATPLQFGFTHNEETGEWAITFSPNGGRTESKPGERALTVCETHLKRGLGQFSDFAGAIAVLDKFASKADGDYVEPAPIQQATPDEGETPDDAQGDDDDGEWEGMDEADRAAYEARQAALGIKTTPEPEPEPEFKDPFAPEPEPEPVRKGGLTVTTSRTKKKRASRAPGGNNGPTPQEIRDWGRKNGWEVNDRGRVPVELTEAYEAAH